MRRFLFLAGFSTLALTVPTMAQTKHSAKSNAPTQETAKDPCLSPDVPPSNRQVCYQIDAALRRLVWVQTNYGANNYQICRQIAPTLDDTYAGVSLSCLQEQLAKNGKATAAEKPPSGAGSNEPPLGATSVFDQNGNERPWVLLGLDRFMQILSPRDTQKDADTNKGTLPAYATEAECRVALRHAIDKYKNVSHAEGGDGMYFCANWTTWEQSDGKGGTTTEQAFGAH